MAFDLRFYANQMLSRNDIILLSPNHNSPKERCNLVPSLFFQTGWNVTEVYMLFFSNTYIFSREAHNVIGPIIQRLKEFHFEITYLILNYLIIFSYCFN